MPRPMNTASMIPIAANIAKVRLRIQHAAERAGRQPDEITLLAVSKTRPATDIARAYHDSQQTHFGENYLQEATAKQAQLVGLPLTWHFIGPVQSNKAAAVARQFDWCHCVDRLKVAQRLHDARPSDKPPLNICIQVNIDDEPSKAGLPLTAIPALVAALADLDRLAVRGLMAIPAPVQAPVPTTDSFQRIALCLTALQQQFPQLPLDTLSMGMSGDLEQAIAAGSTLVRVGTDIFGHR